MTKRRVWAAVAALLLLGAGLYLGGQRARRAAEATEVAALRRELGRLRDRLEELSLRSTDASLAAAPEQGLVIGVPAGVALDVAHQIIDGYLGSVTLTLRDLLARKSGEVEAHVLFADRTVGSYALEAQILVVRTRLRPGELQVSFGGRRLGFDVPVATSEGRGRVRLKLSWQSRGLAGVVCGDVEATRDLDGKILPAVYPMSGSLDIVAEGGSLLLRPRLAQMAIRIRLEATAQAWRAFDELLAQQGALCRGALEKANVKQKVAEVLDRGFEVKLPLELLQDITLPVSVQQSLTLEDGSFLLEVNPAEVVMTAQAIWYGTDVTIERASSDEPDDEVADRGWSRPREKPPGAGSHPGVAVPLWHEETGR